jgi:CHAD domain-containing protein
MDAPYQKRPPAGDTVGVDPYPARACRVALRALARLSAGDSDPETLHRARTHLRRLQAYLEFDGSPQKADAIRRGVSRLSGLRMLQVLARRLKRFGAPKSDRRTVKRRIKAERKKLDRVRTYDAMARLVRRLIASHVPTPYANLAERARRSRAAHADTLYRLIVEGGPVPRRKSLHRIRLELKTIRYQEERLLRHSIFLPGLIRRLRRLQKVLGEYEDLVQFRKLARSLDLRCASGMDKPWRQARLRARAVPAHLSDLLVPLAGSPLRPVPSDRPPQGSVEPAS